MEGENSTFGRNASIYGDNASTYSGDAATYGGGADILGRVAAQVVVLAAGWAQKEDFLTALRAELQRQPT
eukprot:3931786-Rhodomonas_salina.2